MSERGGVAGAVGWVGLGILVLVVFLFFGVCSLFTDDKGDGRSLGRVELIRHDRGCNPDWEDCGRGDQSGGNGNRGYDGEGGRSGDNDQRGDHNCRNFCFYGIPAPGGGDQPPPKDQQPQADVGCVVRSLPFHCDRPRSLTDPRKLPMVIAQIMKSGLDMGQLFATTTIKFVEDLFTALA